MGKSLLFLVAGLTVVTGIVQVRNQDRVTQIPQVTSDYYKAEQARNLAKSLVDNAVETMKADNDWTGSISLDEVIATNVLSDRSNEALYDYAVGNISADELAVIEEGLDGTRSLDVSGTLSTYTQSSQDIPSNSVSSWDEYQVLLVSTSTYEDIQVTTEVLMQRDSFSKYSYLTQSELSSSGSEIWFMDADHIYGPIHSNGTFKMSGTPSFYGLITSPNMWDAHSSNPTSPNFYGGENFNAPYKDAPDSYELSKLTDAAADDGLSFTTDLRLDFYVDGTPGNEVGYVDVTEATGTTSVSCGWSCTETVPSFSGATPVSYSIEDFNGVISTTESIEIEGDVKGNYTVHSGSEITIVGDIEYFVSPLVDSSSTDLLGLVSEGDVVVGKDAHTSSGSQDLTIHASLMALDTSFYVEDYTKTVRGTLNILGGIVQQNRGAVGTFSGSTIVSGYAKNYQYDTRLVSTIPNEFPRESIFSIKYWKDEVTKLEN